MIKKPGTFSKKYMSNPMPSKTSPMNFRDRNKQNRPNNTFDEQEESSEPAMSLNTDKRSASSRNLSKMEARLKLQWQKHEKEVNSQVAKLKKQNQVLRQNARRAVKTNQDNIVKYETTIKEIQNERDALYMKLTEYQEYAQFCIIWIIEAYSLAQNPSKHPLLLQTKLGTAKMTQLIHKITPAIQELQLQQHLLEIASSQPEEYLIFENPSPQPHLSSTQELNNLLDTFDLRKSAQKLSQHEADNLARRLFVNEDTFGHEIGEHSISCDLHRGSQEEAFLGREAEIREGAVLEVRREAGGGNEDHLEVHPGERVKMLRKVGDLWIAEKGAKIGYVCQSIFY